MTPGSFPPALEPLAPGAGPLASVLTFMLSLAAGSLLGLVLRVRRSGPSPHSPWSGFLVRLEALSAGPFDDEVRFYDRLEELVRELLELGGAPPSAALAVEELALPGAPEVGLGRAIEVLARGLGIRFGGRREGEEEAQRQLEVVRAIVSKLRSSGARP